MYLKMQSQFYYSSIKVSVKKYSAYSSLFGLNSIIVRLKYQVLTKTNSTDLKSQFYYSSIKVLQQVVVDLTQVSLNSIIVRLKLQYPPQISNYLIIVSILL